MFHSYCWQIIKGISVGRNPGHATPHSGGKRQTHMLSLEMFCSGVITTSIGVTLDRPVVIQYSTELILTVPIDEYGAS